MLTINRRQIVDGAGKPVQLRGIAIGGWLMMEGYMLGGENMAEHALKADLETKLGKQSVYEFAWEFRKNFFDQTDIQNIKALHLNCVRIPFNYRLLEETTPDGKSGFEYLQEIVGWFAKEEIYVILDMHAVPGSQNADWHSDSDGTARFYQTIAHREHFVRLWDQLSKLFKDETWVAGYDIMNEPVTNRTDLLVECFNQVIKAIRANGDNHIIFLEGNNWAREVDYLKPCLSENVAYSIHFYEPVQFVFWQDHTAAYPGIVAGKVWDKNAIEEYLRPYSELGLPVYVGEFGVSSLAPSFKWVKDALAVFEKLGFHWTYWTYKSVAGMEFPDGVYQNQDEHGQFGRGATQSGFKLISTKLKQNRAAFFQELETRNFKLNHTLRDLLAK